MMLKKYELKHKGIILGARFETQNIKYDIKIENMNKLGVKMYDCKESINMMLQDDLFLTQDECNGNLVENIGINDVEKLKEIGVYTKHFIEKTFADDDSIEIDEHDEKHISYYDKNEGYYRCYYFTEYETLESFSKRVEWDKEVEKYINIDKYIEFIYRMVDRNSIMCLNRLYLIYEDENIDSKLRDEMYEESGFDEYSKYVCDKELGINWVDRSCIVINVSNIIEAVREVILHENEYRHEMLIGIVSTTYHEFRHLLYECNEVVELDEEVYKVNGGMEEEVERYGNDRTEETMHIIDCEIIR